MQDSYGGHEENSVASDTHALVLWAFIHTEQNSSTRGTENGVVVE